MERTNHQPNINMNERLRLIRFLRKYEKTDPLAKRSLTGWNCVSAIIGVALAPVLNADAIAAEFCSEIKTSNSRARQ